MALAPFFGGRGRGARGFFDDDLFDDIIFDDTFWDTTDFTQVQASPDHTPRRHMSRRARAAANMLVDWLETPYENLFRADLPGLRKDDVKVSVEDGFLRINGERPREDVPESYTWHRMERPRGRFSRRFRLPERADPDNIRAHFHDGVLDITVPNKDGKRGGRVRSIDVSS